MPISELPLVVQTAYAELIDQLRNDGVREYPAGSTFRKRASSGRAYWYVQPPTAASARPKERYLGPDTEQLSAAIARAKDAKVDADARKTVVRSLKAAGLPEPDDLTGAVLSALADAGVFRLRALLIGTAAYQTYAGAVGVRMPGALIRTGDIDIAQDYGVSVAVDDAIDASFLDVLRGVDPAFRPVPSLADPAAAAAYARPGGFRVDVLTTNRGAARDAPVALKSLKSDAAPLRHLDFLLKDPVDAALLYKSGVLVATPAPARYAVHKLIVAAMRATAGESAAKSEKDIRQAETLIEALALKRRTDDLRDCWREARRRGRAWREKLDAGARRLKPEISAILLGRQAADR